MQIKTNLLVIGEKPDIPDFLKSTGIYNPDNIYFCGKQENIFTVIKNNNIKIVIMDVEGDDTSYRGDRHRERNGGQGHTQSVPCEEQEIYCL